MLQYLLFLCALAFPDIRALVIPDIEATSEDSKCTDITHCRTIWNIIWTCLVTVFACTWVSIHRNVAPDRQRPFFAFLVRTRIAIWTIIAPEYILAWAIRQWIVARQIATEFNKLPVLLPHARVDRGVGTTSAMQTIGVVSARHDVVITAHEEKIIAVDQREPATKSAAMKQGELAIKLAELWKSVYSRMSDDERWTITHGFFVLMGGFCYVDGDTPHPVPREDLEHIIKTRSFEPPTKLDIDARSESDGFSKTVTILQTLWFVVQCIARAIQHLPITNLEIVTLAYATISFAMYRFWLNKPLNCPPIRLERIAGPEFQSSGSSESLPKVGYSADIIKSVKAVVGTQDDEVQLWTLQQVPTFYAGNPAEHEVLFANAIALAVGAIFGAVHCIAWSFAFPSQTEKLLWRISAVIMVAIPSFYVVFVVLVAFRVNWLLKPALILSPVAIPCYLVARAVLLILTLTTLRDLPPAAYEAIHWMSFIPHV